MRAKLSLTMTFYTFMPKVTLKITLLEMSGKALELIYAACRQCYSEKSASDIFLSCADKSETVAAFIKKVVSSGHESPLEHVKFTFAVEGVSRALTHQLVRHRLASYSQQSQRYVRENDFDYIIPPVIEGNKQTRDEFEKIMREIQKSYSRLLEIMSSEEDIHGESANQDARFVLPQAAETKIVVTMNCRELLHFFKHRCCTRAQWEIRALANEMLSICKEKLPAVFTGAGAKCEDLGYCPEGEKFCCGKFPVKEKFLGA